MSTEESQQTQEQTQTQTRTRQPNFNSLLRKDKETYESVHKLVQHLATSTGQEFDALWAHVTDRDDAHFKRHFRRLRKKNDPFHDIKNAVPAYSFFTQEWNSKVAKEHPELSFGEKSKLVGEKWRNLSDKEKSKYEKLAVKDKKRYQEEVEQRSRELATTAPAESTSTEPVTEAVQESSQSDSDAAPVESEPVVDKESKPSKAKGKSRAPAQKKGGKRSA
jgi:hypothetical protein